MYFFKVCFIFYLFYLFIFKDLFFLLMIDTQRERGRDTGRGRSRLHAGTPMWHSITGLWDHALSQKQTLNN